MAGFTAGFHPHPAGFAHRWTAKLLGASMWFWMMYRFKQDGAVMLGWRHPWEHHGHGHDEHAHDEPHH